MFDVLLRAVATPIGIHGIWRVAPAEQSDSTALTVEEEIALVIRATVPHRLIHRNDRGRFNGSRVWPDDPQNSTDRINIPLKRPRIGSTVEVCLDLIDHR